MSNTAAAASQPRIGSLGAKPELKWISIDKLFVDSGYQRSTSSRASQKNLEYMKENFSWAHCGALMVCLVPSEKKYAVIDGQHRLAAAQARDDIDEMPCMVITGHDFQNQAKSFVIVNTKRVTMNNLAKYHAAAAAGETDAVALKDFLEECDIEIPNHPVAGADLGPRQTLAVSGLAKMLKNYTAEQLKWALTIIPDAYGEKKGMLCSSLIKAMVAYIKAYPDVERDRMLQALRKIDPDDIENSAREYVKISGGKISDAMVIALERHYKSVRGGASASNAIAESSRAAPQAKAVTPMQPKNLKFSGDDYIGERTDATIEDADYPDIQRMRSNGLPLERIAKSYGVELEYLKAFIAKMEASPEGEPFALRKTK